LADISSTATTATAPRGPGALDVDAAYCAADEIDTATVRT
jgi:hypothetical protein